MPKNTAWIKGKPSPYQYRQTQHFPDWHNLIVWDAFFNNLAAGTMLVTAIVWLFGSRIFANLLPVALTAAFMLVIVDLFILISDLGDPKRFINSLRVMRFTSPLSVGVWGLVSFSIFAFIAAVLSWIGAGCANTASLCYYYLYVLIRVATVLAALGAVVVICYKGVVFSCSSQPGVKNGRWLTPFMVSDSLLMGLSVYILLALFFSRGPASAFLTIPYIILLCARCVTFALLWVDVKPRARLVHGAENKFVGWTLYIVGGVLAFILAFCGPIGLLLAAAIALGCGVMERYWIIGLTHPVPLKPERDE
ncbi:MAG: polysulfide reductase NrfD [Desulfovibrio sp.]|nr:polysulfide reductase NrfD [Desulfovibrio sp.]